MSSLNDDINLAATRVSAAQLVGGLFGMGRWEGSQMVGRQSAGQLVSLSIDTYLCESVCRTVCITVASG